MEIIVEGKASASFTPNQVIINLDFITKSNTYDEVLELGTNNVYDFVQELIIPNGFTKEDLKTRNFIIREEQKYNEVTRKYEFDGFSYNQSALLKFDYDKEIMTRFMVMLSKLANPPKVRVNFGVKNERECQRSILKLAYQDAFEQASAIAVAAGKNLKECVKVDFKPFTTNYVSHSSFGEDMVMFKEAAMGRGAAETITNIFTPEDIEIFETLYCLWITD